MAKRINLVVGLICLAIGAGLSGLFVGKYGHAGADWAQFVETREDFETVTSFLQSAIEEEGLSIANRGNVADMLKRTKDAIGGEQLAFKRAEIFQFCSAKLGHKLFSIDPKNLASCPLTIVT